LRLPATPICVFLPGRRRDFAHRVDRNFSKTVAGKERHTSRDRRDLVYCPARLSGTKIGSSLQPDGMPDRIVSRPSQASKS